MMGSPDGEIDSYRSESPQHEVTVQTFFLGKYPITQAQWRWVADLPQVECELKADPAYFKPENDENLPIEQVEWWDAQEFCARLSEYTGRNYRLPSEAEWEYACRARTTTPFHFGETISSEVANYFAQDWEHEGRTYPGKYAAGKLGEYRKKTTSVGLLKAANNFGLYDMHGNVWEWCLDHWHDNYEGAPIDGSAWLSTNEKPRYVARGGSWNSIPRNCRSAARFNSNPENSSDNIGFRVVCEIPRTL
jgi:formylglycine-generating enzyme required for sulfatase activity